MVEQITAQGPATTLEVCYLVEEERQENNLISSAQ